MIFKRIIQSITVDPRMGLDFCHIPATYSYQVLERLLERQTGFFRGTEKKNWEEAGGKTSSAFSGKLTVNHTFFWFWVSFHWMSSMIYLSVFHLCCWFSLYFFDLTRKISELLDYLIHYEVFRVIVFISALDLEISPPTSCSLIIMKLYLQHFFPLSSMLCFSSLSSLFLVFFGMLGITTGLAIWVRMFLGKFNLV